MSNKPNCYFKTNKYTTQNKFSSKISGRANLYINFGDNPIRIEYPRQLEVPDYHLQTSENIVCYSPESNKNLTKNLEIIQEETNVKFNSPKATKYSKAISTSSNLPTANNSFHTAISTPENENYQDELYSYREIRNRKTSGKFNKNRKRSNADSDLDSLEFSEMITNCGMPEHNNKKKSDDFKIKFKTELCKFWELDAVCKYGDNCAFAHGMDEMRLKSEITSHYRTKKCKQFFENGFCTYGQRCQFAHSEKKPKYFSYKKFLNLFDSNKKTEVIINLTNVTRPRLSVFEKITKSDKKDVNLIKANSFLDDVKRFLHNLNTDKMVTNNKSNDIHYTNIKSNLQRSRLLSL